MENSFKAALKAGRPQIDYGWADAQLQRAELLAAQDSIGC